MKKILAAVLSAVTAVTILHGWEPLAPANAESREPKLIALTFDDGPNTTTTNQVLDLLEAYQAKASFFLIGDNINAESAASVKRAYEMGMEIDNHSRSHSNMSKMTPAELEAEIAYVDEQVTEITGEHTKFFRPPFIDVSQSMYDTIRLPFICGIDCQDYMENVSAQERADHILNGARDGAIVLLHDAAGNDQTVEALKIAMPVLAEQGYEFVTLTELFERQGETPKKNILYSNVAKYPCQGYQVHSTLPGDAADRVSIDPGLLEELGDACAVEVEYESPTGYAPVIALQRWSSTPSIWQTIQPFYFNGDRAVFLGTDLAPVFRELDITAGQLDGITITAYSGDITLKNARLLIPSGDAVPGDVNGDGACSVADVVLLQKWLLGMPDAKLTNWKAADLLEDGQLNGADLARMQQLLR